MNNMNFLVMGICVFLCVAISECNAGQAIEDLKAGYMANVSLLDSGQVNVNVPAPINVTEGSDYQRFLADSGVEPVKYVLDQINAIIPLMARYGYPVSNIADFTAYVNENPQEWKNFKEGHDKELGDLSEKLTLEFDIQKDKNFVSLVSGALESKEKVFVWAGRNHLLAHTGDFRRSVGYYLNQKYPGKIFSIMMHDQGEQSTNFFGVFIEKEVLKYTDSPIAFSLYQGPFGKFSINEKHVLKDIFDGYIYLCPFSAYQHTQPLLAK